MCLRGGDGMARASYLGEKLRQQVVCLLVVESNRDNEEIFILLDWDNNYSDAVIKIRFSIEILIA